MTKTDTRGNTKIKLAPCLLKKLNYYQNLPTQKTPMQKRFADESYKNT